MWDKPSSLFTAYAMKKHKKHGNKIKNQPNSNVAEKRFVALNAPLVLSLEVFSFSKLQEKRSKFVVGSNTKS